MKKYMVMLLALLLLLLCFSFAAVAEEGSAERTVASYEYMLGEEGGYAENLIYNADVIISGDNSQMVFSNCEFNGNIILTANEATRVMLLGCEVNGVCILRNEVAEANIDYNNPKFLTTSPVTVECEGGAGSVVALGDFEVVFAGETYTLADSQLFINADGSLVPYEGQEASYFVAAQWIEGGEQVTMIVCEFDPTM